MEGAKGSQAAGAAMAGTSSTSGAAKLLLLAVAAGMVAAAVAAVRRWQPWKQHKFGGGLLSLPSLLLRRRQQQKGPQQDDAAVELLVVASDAPPDQLRRRQPHASELVPGRARMKALVQRQMGGSALSGRREKRLLSMGTLPQALAHELNSGKRPNGAGKLASIRGGGSGDSQGSATSSGSEPIVVRRWGLETDSLRMSVSDLQVGCAASCGMLFWADWTLCSLAGVPCALASVPNSKQPATEWQIATLPSPDPAACWGFHCSDTPPLLQPTAPPILPRSSLLNQMAAWCSWARGLMVLYTWQSGKSCTSQPRSAPCGVYCLWLIGWGGHSCLCGWGRVPGRKWQGLYVAAKVGVECTAFSVICPGPFGGPRLPWCMLGDCTTDVQVRCIS